MDAEGMFEVGPDRVDFLTKPELEVLGRADVEGYLASGIGVENRAKKPLERSVVHIGKRRIGLRVG